MLSHDNLRSIEDEGRRLGAAARAAPDRAVPQYPGWDLSDLASHTASIHGRTTQICRELPQESISAPRLPADRDPIDWYDETLEEMVAALGGADPATPVWTVVPGTTLGFWETRMVVETGVHRWDADQALGGADPLTDVVARAGLDEFAGMWLHRLGPLPALELTTELGVWHMGDGAPTEHVDGTASDVYLRLMSRPTQAVLPDAWATAVDGLAPPPKR